MVQYCVNQWDMLAPGLDPGSVFGLCLLRDYLEGAQRKNKGLSFGDLSKDLGGERKRGNGKTFEVG